jgi:hypothetical protein
MHPAARLRALPDHAYRGHGGLVVASLNHRQPAASAGAAAHALAASAKPASAERLDMLGGPVETARAPASEMHAFGEQGKVVVPRRRSCFPRDTTGAHGSPLAVSGSPIKSI